MVGQLTLFRDVFHNLGNLLSVGLIVFHFHKHIRLMRVMYHPRTRCLIRRYPKIAFKYLINYAALNLATRHRLALVTSHYSLVQQCFNDEFSVDLHEGKLRMWESDQGGDGNLTLHLNFPSKFHTEGDLCITMCLAGREIYRVVFVLSSGLNFGLGQPNVIFVTCVQGLAKQVTLRSAAARCDDVHPADLLMSAIAGVAASLNITVVGIRSDQQICNSGRTYFSYDSFFEQYGVLNPVTNAYVMTVPIEHKELTLIAPKHRARTRRKRVFRDGVSDSVQQALAPYLTNPRH